MSDWGSWPLVLWRLVTQCQTAAEVHAVRQLSSHTRALKAQWQNLIDPQQIAHSPANHTWDQLQGLIDFKALTRLDLVSLRMSLTPLPATILSLTVGILVSEEERLCQALAWCGPTLARLDLSLFGVCAPCKFRHLRDLPVLPSLTWLGLKCLRVSNAKVARSLLRAAPYLAAFEYLGNELDDEVVPLLSGLTSVSVPFSRHANYKPLTQSQSRPLGWSLVLRLKYHNQKDREKLVRICKVPPAILECTTLAITFGKAQDSDRTGARLTEVGHVSPSNTVLDALLLSNNLQLVELDNVGASTAVFDQVLRIRSKRLRLRARATVDFALIVTARAETLVLEHMILTLCDVIPDVGGLKLELLQCTLEFGLRELAGFKLESVKLTACTLPNGCIVNRACL